MSNFVSKYKDMFGNALNVGDRVLFAKRVGNTAQLEERFVERITEKGLFLNKKPEWYGPNQGKVIGRNSTPVANFENIVKFPETKVDQLWAALYLHRPSLDNGEPDQAAAPYYGIGQSCTSLSCAKDSVQVLNRSKVVGFVALESDDPYQYVTANTYALDRWDDKKGDA